MKLRKHHKSFIKRAAALVLAVLCVAGLLPSGTASAVDGLESFGKRIIRATDV